MEGEEEEFHTPRRPPAAQLRRGSPACPNRSTPGLCLRQPLWEGPYAREGKPRPPHRSQYPVPDPSSPLTQTTHPAIPSLVFKGQTQEAELRVKALGPEANSVLAGVWGREGRVGTHRQPEAHSGLIAPAPEAPSPFPLRAHSLPPDLTRVPLGMLGRGLQEGGLQGGDPLWLGSCKAAD